VIAGKDKGKSGVVLRALPKENAVVVEGVALYNALCAESRARSDTSPSALARSMYQMSHSSLLRSCSLRSMLRLRVRRKS